MDTISWHLIDKYFKDKPSNLVAHHLDSYNDFFSKGEIQNNYIVNYLLQLINKLEIKKKNNIKIEKILTKCIVKINFERSLTVFAKI